MSKQTQFKAGDAAFVKPKADGGRGYADKDIKIPYPPDARPIRYLPVGVWTRVRLTPYLMEIYAQGNLHIEAELPTEQKADKPKAQASGGGDK